MIEVCAIPSINLQFALSLINKQQHNNNNDNTAIPAHTSNFYFKR